MLIAQPPLYLLDTEVRCWSCDAVTRVVALVSNQLVSHEDGEAYALGEGLTDFLKLSYVEAMPADLLEEIRSYVPRFGPADSATAKTRYFANHCQHCGAFQGDHYVHSEPGSGFFPTTDEECDGIRAHTLRWSASLETEASWGSSSGVDRVLRTHLMLPEPARPKPRARRPK